MTAREIVNFLTEHAGRKTVSFHMPGHKGSAIYRRYGFGEFLDNIMDCDITEIPGADNLFQAEGILKAAQDGYASLYGAKKSYLLINGTSGGVIAAITAAVPKGKKLIMARNCHKSIYNGLILGGIEPVYAYPEMVEEYGIAGEITAGEIERLLTENPDAEAVILPSPNYYGICSDIRKIAETVHRHGKVLIVDQAHGAHLKFFSECGYSDMPESAEEQGADIVVNSIHKTLASFTQSAVLNLMSDRVDNYTLEDRLQMIQSTSPSYLLMASLDINAALLAEHKTELMKEWHDALTDFYREALNIRGLSVIGNPFDSRVRVNLDITKINLDMSALGLSAAELEEKLMARGIYAELTTGSILMCMTGIGNTAEHLRRLADALKEISGECLAGAPESGKISAASALNRVFEVRLELRPIPAERERIPLAQGAGRVCASSIIPYPPGIPFVCPGEVLTPEVIEYIKDLRCAGEKVIGVNDKGEITVGKNN